MHEASLNILTQRKFTSCIFSTSVHFPPFRAPCLPPLSPSTTSQIQVLHPFNPFVSSHMSSNLRVLSSWLPYLPHVLTLRLPPSSARTPTHTPAPPAHCPLCQIHVASLDHHISLPHAHSSTFPCVICVNFSLSPMSYPRVSGCPCALSLY